MDRNFEHTEKRMTMALRDYYEPAEKAVLREMLRRAAALPPGQAIPAVQALSGRQRPGAGHRRLPGEGLRRHPAEGPGDGELLAEEVQPRNCGPWMTRSSSWPSPSTPTTGN